MKKGFKLEGTYSDAKSGKCVLSKDACFFWNLKDKEAKVSGILSGYWDRQFDAGGNEIDFEFRKPVTCKAIRPLSRALKKLL